MFVSQPLLDIVNTALRADPLALDALKPLVGSILSVEFKGLGWVIPIEIVERGSGSEGVMFRDAGHQHADLSVVLTPGALVRARWTSLQEAVATGEIQLHGDIRLAQRVEAIVKHFDIDWWAMVSAQFGDRWAWRLQQIGQGVRKYVDHVQNTAMASTRAYLQEESALLVHPEEVLLFNQSVDQLRDQYARVWARLERLNPMGAKQEG
jgi:ubiquinone biosynthesis protein UbiJ